MTDSTSTRAAPQHRLFSPWSAEAAEKIFAQFAPAGAGEAPILPILTALQQNFGYVDSRAITRLAQKLGVERIKIYAVMTQNRGFRRQPPTAGALKICRAEACRKQGAEILVAYLESRHGLRLDAAPAQTLRLETAYCLGACGRGPNMTINGVVHGGLDAAQLDVLMRRLREN